MSERPPRPAGDRVPAPWPDDGVILYDGVCVLCSGLLRFVAPRDPARRFRFAAIQTAYGRSMAAALGIDPDDPDTNAVVIDGQAHRRSDAVIAVLSRLPGWRWARWLRFVPRPVRDAGYGLVARNRYRVFGRHDACDLGGPDLRDRVIDDQPVSSPLTTARTRVSIMAGTSSRPTGPRLPDSPR